MAIKLQLKLRPVKGTVQIPIETLRKAVKEKRAEALFEEVLAHPQDIHDKEWLAMIANYVPEGKSTSLTEMAPWLKLAVRINELDDNREGPFTLSAGQSKLMWDRLNSTDFKLKGLPPQFAAFVLDFAAGYQAHFAALTDDLNFDDEVPTSTEKLLDTVVQGEPK